MDAGETAIVSVIEHAPGVLAGCSSCRKVIAKGHYAVGVQIGIHKFLVGENPPREHCGEKRRVPRLFDDPTKAEEAKMEVMETLARDGTTENLKLLELARFISTATH